MILPGMQRLRASLSVFAACLLFANVVAHQPLAHADDSQIPPTDKDQLFEWLSGGKYKHWVAESGPHKSAGPHPVSVIAYLNEKLNSSLAANSNTHPQGAAAVKELLDGNGNINGWAVSVKTDVDSKAGQGWYWYEILGSTADSSVVANGNGVPLCFGCHTPGNDFVLIPHPLK